MNPADDLADERLSTLLAEYHTALSDGSAATWQAAPLPAELSERLERAQACLRRLEADRQVQLRQLPPPAMAEPRRLGRFRIQRELGRGAFGIVYLALDPQLRRNVALKMLRLEALLDPDARTRFLREGRAAAVLHHPHLVPVYEAGEADGVCYLVSTYCPGPTLAAWLQEQPDRADPRLAAELVRQLADAVQYMHDQGILHRDIKPSNVLLEAASPPGGEVGWVPRLTDFGLVKDLSDASATVQTRSDALVGTPRYMAPEQAEGRVRQLGPRTDVYALGLLLYELLAGRPAFHGATALEIVRQIADEEPPRPGQVRPGVPRDLDTICLQCLQKEPGRRYASARALAEDLERWLTGKPIHARPAGVVERSWKRLRRHSVAGAALLLAAVTMGSLVAGMVVLRGTDSHRGFAVPVGQPVSDLGELQRRRDYLQKISQAVRALERQDTLTAADLLTKLRPSAGKPDLRGFEWHYLWGQCPDEGLCLAGQELGIVCLAYSPDGRVLASASGDWTVRLWDVNARQAKAILRGHGNMILGVAFAPDGRTVVTADADGAVRLWDTATGTPQVVLRGHGDPVKCVAFAPDGRTLALAGGNAILLWDLSTRAIRARCVGHRGEVRGVAFSFDGRLLASGGGDDVIRLWDANTGRLHAELPGGQGTQSLAFSPDGRFLAAGHRDRGVSLWDAATWQRRATLDGGPRPVFAVAFAVDGKRLAAVDDPVDAAGGNHVTVWELADTAVIPPPRSLRHAKHIFCAAFAPDGRGLALGRGDGSIHIWRPKPVVEQLRLPGHGPEEAWCAAFAPDGQRLVTGGDNEKHPDCIKVWDAATGQQLWTGRTPDALVSCAAWSPDGSRIATGSYDHTVRLWSAAGGKELAVLKGHTRPLRALAFSPDGRLLATGGADRHIQLWEVATGRLARTLAGHFEEVRGLAFAPDGSFLVSASGDRSLRVWDPHAGTCLREIREASPALCLAVTRDGRSVFAGYQDGSIRRWDPATGAEREHLAGHLEEVRALALAPDGKTLASAGADRTIRLWNAATGAELLVLRGHEAAVNGVAFSPTGRRLASAAHDGSVRVWVAATDEAAPGHR